MKVIEVYWRDSRRYLYQMQSDEAMSFTTIRSVGFLVSRNKKQIVLAQDDIEGDVRGVIAIPLENVIKVRTLSSSVHTKRSSRSHLSTDAAAKPFV